MEINSKIMGNWEMQKAGYLITVAGNLGMDVSGYGFLDVNQNSGNVYLWAEDYQFCLYMPISCNLVKTDVWAVWSDPENGEEIKMRLQPETRLIDIENWVTECEHGEHSEI